MRAAGELRSRGWGARYSIYWLYWYKSTNTDAEGACFGAEGGALGTQFTGFTSTQVQILTQKALAGEATHCSLHKSAAHVDVRYVLS